MIDPPAIGRAVRVIAGPEKVRNELCWWVELDGGQPAVLAQLLPELAAEEPLRRRYAYEIERLAERHAPRLAPILAVGPAPDPRDPSAGPPWRLRADPRGRSLEAWLVERAPAPLDQAIDLVATLCDAVAGVHELGVVVRDLDPRSVVLDEADGRPWLLDLGLARLHILTTLTASSLMLETTAYAAPEHVRAAVVDPRADVYSLGVILWRALTGTLPFGGRHALLRDYAALPALSELLPDAPPRLADLLGACLAEDASSRPHNAAALAALLRGEGDVDAPAIERIVCQACGTPLRPGLRLCLACGREAVQFRHLGGARKSYVVFLEEAAEEATFDAALRGVLDELAGEQAADLDFLIGDVRMYSKRERLRRHRLPAPLFVDVDRETAHAIATRLRASGLTIKVRVRRAGTMRGRVVFGAGLAAIAGGVVGIAAGALGLGLGLLLASPVVIAVGASMRHREKLATRPELARLRDAPAALPASDPLVARLADLLDPPPADDIRELVGDLALGIQRLIDRRAQLADAGRLDAVTEPVEPLVAIVERHARAVADLDDSLSELDEVALVRALAAAEARAEPPEKRRPLLDALDRLRELEDRRTAHLERLLEAASLIRRSIELGLSERDEARFDQALRRLAEAELDADA